MAAILRLASPGSADSAPPLVLIWQVEVPRGHGLCVGDFGPGPPVALVTDEENQLTVVSASGKKLRRFPVPIDMDQIEVGHLGVGKPALLGFRNWGPSVNVVDAQGHKLWSAECPQGADSAHWADLDHDGKDELLVGLNGGGLRAYGPDGKLRWERAELGTVCNQATVKASGKTTILVTTTRGEISKLDAHGQPDAPMRPDDLSIAPMVAASFGGEPQVLFEGEEISQAALLKGAKSWLVATDVEGEVKWRRETSSKRWTWQVPRVVWGDVLGRGVTSWVFFSKPDVLSVVNGAGHDLASLHFENIERMAVLKRPGQCGLVLLLSKGTLSAFAVHH